MINAKDVTAKQFDKATFGYKPEDVDDFLREVAMTIAQLQKDKEETEKKLEVLVDKVREYKNDEESLKAALIGAQKQGKLVIAEAEETAKKIIADANYEADRIIGSTRIDIVKEKECLAKMQQEVSDFKSNLLEMYREHLAKITNIPDYDTDDEEEEEETAVDEEATRVIETPAADGSSFN